MEPEASLPHSQYPTRPYPEPNHSMTPHPTFWRYILILSSHLRSSKWSLSLRFPHQNPVYASPLRYMCHMLRLPHSSRYDHAKNIKWGLHIIKLLIIQFFPLPSYLVPFKPKYSPQHPILKHPQPTFLPQCERPSFTPIKNYGQSYSSVYLNPCIFG